MSEQPGRQPRWLAQLTAMKLLVVLLVVYLLIQVQMIILLILLAILFATVIEMPLRRLENRGMPRSLGILTIYALILAALVVLLLVFVPLVSREAQEFGRQAPVLVDQLAENWRASDNPLLSGSGYRLLTRLSFQLENPPAPPGGAAIDALGRVALVGLGLVSMFVMGFYWLMEKTLIRQLLLSNLDEATGDRIARIWEDVEGKVGGWLRGQLLLCLIIGGSAGIGYYLLDVRFWLLLAVVAGVMELIPILGPWVGGIPAVMVALLDSWEKAAIVAIFLILLQLAENAVLVPRIMKGTIGLSPLTVFIAVLAGGAYMGVLGALLAIPFAAALQVVVGDLIRERQRQLQLATGLPSPALDWRGIFGQPLSPEQIERAARTDKPEASSSGSGRSARDPTRPPASEPGS